MEISAVEEDFIEKFLAIQGYTIGERRKNLFYLLRTYNKLELDLTKLKPRNQLEEIFKIDVLIYLKNTQDIVNIFKTENPALIKKVLKIDWLWDFFDEKIIKEIFPQISFNCKLKILNKLSTHLTNTRQADAIFAVINEKYGMYLAAKMVSCCSSSLISQVVELNCGKHLKARQILLIIKKHPGLTNLILENVPTALICNIRIFIEVFYNHAELLKKYAGMFYMKLGRRATNKFVRTNKANVVNNPDLFYRKLHKNQIIKRIGVDFSQFYVNMLPETYDEFIRCPKYYLELLEDQNNLNTFELFASSFQTKYGIDLFNADVIECCMLELMNNEQRSHIAKRLAIPSIIWICLDKTNKSLPALQKLIDLTSDSDAKEQLIGSLVETCRINNDKQALLEVCKYFYKFHRHAGTSVCTNFLDAIQKCFSLNKLNEGHWFYIGRILKIILIQDRWFRHTECLYAYCCFLFEQNSSLQTIARICAQKGIDVVNLGYRRYVKLCREFEKQYLIVFGEVLPTAFENEELTSKYVAYLCGLIKWNGKHSNIMLSLFHNKPAISAVLEKCKNDCDESCKLILSRILRMKLDEDKSLWLVTYFKKATYNNMHLVELLIKYEPQLLCEHIEIIIKSILEYNTEKYQFFFRMSKNYSHLELPEKITEICMNAITSRDESESRKKNALIALSYIITQPERFITLLTPYYPVTNTESDANVYSMQQVMCISLGNIVPPSSMLQSVLLFSKGDYTKFNRRSMYLIACNVTEDKLVKFFSDLNNLAVSVRKHAIYLGFTVLDRHTIYNIIRRNLPDKNVSICKFLLRSIFNFFVQNPDVFLWDMLKKSIRNVDTEDKEAMDVLIQLEKVPPSYMTSYIKFIIPFLVLDNNVANLIPDSVYANLETDFVLKVIDSERCETTFICKNIINSNASELQLAILEKAFNKYRDLNTAPELLRKCAGYFITKEHSNLTLLHKCTELLGELQPNGKYLDDCLYLQLCEMYVDYYVKQESVSKFAEALIIATDVFITKYKPFMLQRFCKVVNTFIKDYFDENLMALIQSIIEYNCSEHAFVMAISLLPRRLPEAPNKKFVFKKIIELLHLNEHPTVSMTLSLYLNEVMQCHCVVREHIKEKTQYRLRHIRRRIYYEYAYANIYLRFD